MGWGEPRSAAMVQRAQERLTADELAAAAGAFLEHPTTGKNETMAQALDRYRTARTT
jgi:enoyl reductase-like protein